MQLPDLAAFLAVASDRSFSAAARRMHRTQPAISQAVRRIEDELGERLFDRSSRDGPLTEAGRRRSAQFRWDIVADRHQKLFGRVASGDEVCTRRSDIIARWPSTRRAASVLPPAA